MRAFFSFSDKLIQLSQQAEQDCAALFSGIDSVCACNEAKVLSAFTSCGVGSMHLLGSNGYGYGDIGREMLDRVFAHAVGAEDALVRHGFVSGTHALSVALFGVLRMGDTMVSLTGAPYDTMEQVIGLRGHGNGSLADFGIQYKQLDLLPDGGVDCAQIPDAVKDCKVAYIQRSRGYTLRESLGISKIAQVIAQVRESNPHAIVVVDNCYGEFVEQQEPLQAGADIIVGSLIKNPGGGIAQTGGYIAGRKKLVELCGYRLTAVGMGKDVGCTLDQNRSMFMGLFFAPSVVAASVKTSVFALRLFDLMGFDVFPAFDAPRTDIIAAVKLQNKQNVLRFCRGIQKGSPVDSFVTPEAWAMPGYDSEVVMAAGAFTMGASIELSADAPLREPYAVWFQGGLTYHTGKLGILTAAQQLMGDIS